ncbi:MAG: hypothetical protein ACUVTW_13940 [Thermogutta sp.]
MRTSTLWSVCLLGQQGRYGRNTSQVGWFLWREKLPSGPAVYSLDESRETAERAAVRGRDEAA